MPEKRWTVGYDSDGYEEWWEVRYNGNRVYRAEDKGAAEWLADLFNRFGTVPPSERK